MLFSKVFDACGKMQPLALFISIKNVPYSRSKEFYLHVTSGLRTPEYGGKLDRAYLWETLERANDSFDSTK